MIKRLRARYPLTQVELAQKVGINIKSLQAIEQGRAKPRPATIRRLAAALDVTARELAEAADAG